MNECQNIKANNLPFPEIPWNVLGSNTDRYQMPSGMGFFRSSFLFVYNIPSFVTEHMVLANIRRLEYVKFLPQFYDNMRCGFALMEIDETRMSASETEQITNEVLSRIRAKNFSGQTIEVDEVWFKSAGKDSEVPHQDLLKSNFIFVYNLPSNGYSQTELEALTQSNNVIFLPEIDDDTRCAFVEVPELSENDWDMLLSTVRKYTRRGCQFSVDEIWLNPVNEEKLRPPPPIPDPAPQSRLPIVRDYQPPPPNILTAPMPPRQPPIAPIPPFGPPGWTPGSIPGIPPQINPQMNLRPPIQPPHPSAVDVMDPGQIVDTSNLTTVKRILTAKSLRGSLSTLLDEEIRALGQYVNTNIQILQTQVQAQQPTSMAVFFENIQIIHAEHCSRRNGHLPLTGMDNEYLSRALVLATSKIEMTNSAGFIPGASTMPSTSQGFTGNSRPKLEGEPSPKRFAPDVSVANKNSASTDVETDTTYLFVNKIPKSLTLIQLLSGVPYVDNFVFSESNDLHTKSGFAFLKSNSNSLLSEIVQAFRKNGPGIEVFRVCLEPLTDGASEPQSSSSNVNRPPNVPAPPAPPHGTLVQFSLGNGTKKANSEAAKATSPAGVTLDELAFMENTGFNDEQAPIVYCVEVRGMPISTTESQFSKVVKDRVGRMNEYCLLTDVSNKSRRALFFGGSREEATALQTKLKSLLQTVHHKLEFRVLLTNRPETLAPMPQRLTSEIKSRRLLISNLPDWPTELLLMRIGKFAPKALTYLAPRASDQANTSLGHIYLGYESHEEADADLYRLDGWKLTSNDKVKVQLVVDTGWGKNGPLADTVGNCRQLERILRYRREVGADRVKLHYIKDILAKYKVGAPLPSLLHQTLGQYIYEGALENLYAMVIRRLPLSLDLDNFIKRIVKGKLFGLEASSMISSTGDFKEVTVFFGSRDSAVVDNACTIFRELVSSRNRDFMAVVQDCRGTPEIERHLGDTFVPVTKDFAMRRGCQFLIFSNIPPDTEKIDCLYGLRSLCPNARSFYVPTGASSSGSDTGKVLGFAVARFNDPRQCRAAFLALSPTCTLAGGTTRVSFAALHKVLSTTYMDHSYSVPLHVWYSWLRYNPETSSSDPWVLDNTSRSPFFCTCHHVVLPFKPTQFKGFTGRKSK